MGWREHPSLERGVFTQPARPCVRASFVSSGQGETQRLPQEAVEVSCSSEGVLSSQKGQSGPERSRRLRDTEW